MRISDWSSDVCSSDLRVAAYLPNIPAAVVGLLACASLGAIWTLCSPDMGTNAVLDRLRQTEPKALIAVDGVFYADKAMDRSMAVAEIRRQLPSTKALDRKSVV